MTKPIFVRAKNELLFSAEGRSWIDLLSGFGTVFLGHGHPRILAAVQDQMQGLWHAGGLRTAAYLRAKAEVEACFPAGWRLAGLYSSGMEACEFALRCARIATGRPGACGFAGSHHGKSLATAGLGWSNTGAPTPSCFTRLPFVDTAADDEVLSCLELTVARDEVGALFVEPVQGSNGGWRASDRLYQGLASICRARNVLLVWDEILTGFHRTGPRFTFEAIGLVPDVVVFGKACGNGFPVSGVVVGPGIELSASMLPGSTYAGNALAATVVSACLRELCDADTPRRVGRIEAVVQRHFAWVEDSPVRLRGSGALWTFDLASGMDAAAIESQLGEEGVHLRASGGQFRLLPASTIGQGHLETACDIVARVLRQAIARR